MVLDVLERGADGVQTPGLGHGLRGGGQRIAASAPAAGAALDEDAPVPAAAADAVGPFGEGRGRHGRGRGSGQEEVRAGGGEDGVAEAVVEVPDPLERRLGLRRVPPHRRRRARGPGSRCGFGVGSGPSEGRGSGGAEGKGNCDGGTTEAGGWGRSFVLLVRLVCCGGEIVELAGCSLEGGGGRVARKARLQVLSVGASSFNLIS